MAGTGKTAMVVMVAMVVAVVAVDRAGGSSKTVPRAVAPNIKIHGCMQANASALPFCNTSLSFDERAADLVSRLTMDEKVTMMDSSSHGVPRLGLPGYNWGVEDLHGAGTQCVNDAHGQPHCPTIFPILSNLAAGFNATVWTAVGTVIGREMRGANNAGARRARHPVKPGHADSSAPIGVNGWGPNLNIARDPRWGRNDEVPSEDSFLAGKVGAAMIRGIQGDPNAEYMQLLGALKHVTAYSLESWEDDTGGPKSGTKYSRFGFDANISRHDLAETYLEQYRIPIVESNPLGMMCSYAATNGTASCEDHHLLTNWARESIGFEGNVVTDCGALSMTSEPKDPKVSAANAVNAGTDLNCGGVFNKGLQAAVEAGLTTEAAMDASIRRSVGLLMRAGYFDPVEDVPYSAITPEDIGTAASHEVAFEAAKQGLVLLRNENEALPLRTGRTTAVIGPLANATLNLMGRYYDSVCPGPLDPSRGGWGRGERASGCIVSPLAAVSKRGKVIHASGWDCANDKPGDHCVGSTSQAGFSDATSAAKQADQIVLFLGNDPSIESEGRDRQSLTLPGAQEQLLQAVREAAPSTPIVVVLFNGGCIAMNYSLADAVIEAFKPGIEGSEAVACTLFGEPGCNRFGKLPITVFPSTFAGHGGNDMSVMSVSGPSANSQRTYKYYDGAFGQIIFSFGFGLSYSTWESSWATDPAQQSGIVSATENVTLSVNIKNSGSVAGDQVLLLFHVPQRAQIPVPVDMPVPKRRLAGYHRVSLGAGETTTVSFTVGPEELALVDNNGDTLLFAGTHGVEVSMGLGEQPLEHSISIPTTSTLRVLHW